MIGTVTSNEPADRPVPPPIGPVRYTLVLPAKNENGEETGEVVSMVVNGLALPRPGDHLHFEADGAVLSPVVREVDHWFFPPEDGPRHRELAVTADVPMDENPTVRKLLNREERERWIARFTMLENDLD